MVQHTRNNKIYGYGKIPLNTFMEEKKARDKLMRQLIEKEINTTGTMTPRT